MLALQFNNTECRAVAVNVASWFAGTLPAVAVNVVEVVPAGTVTELDPSSSSVLLLDSKTSVPPAGAAPVNVTVHVVEASEFTLFGLQVNWETETICPKATLDTKKTLIPMTATSTCTPKNACRSPGTLRARRPTLFFKLVLPLTQAALHQT
jgi:hypothetical protein